MSIVITGNPGVGKHTIVNKIRGSVGFPVLDLNQFAKQHNLFEKTSDGIEVDTEKLRKLVSQEITTPHIIVGHLAPYSISDIPIKIIIILRRHPKELFMVYQNRNYSEKKTRENLGSEVLGIIVNDTLHRFNTQKIVQIEVTESESDTAKMVLDAINGKQVSREIDWLGTLDDVELRKYFSYD